MSRWRYAPNHITETNELEHRTRESLDNDCSICLLAFLLPAFVTMRSELQQDYDASQNGESWKRAFGESVQ